MADDNRIEAELAIETDQQSVNQSKGAIREIREEVERIGQIGGKPIVPIDIPRAQEARSLLSDIQAQQQDTVQAVSKTSKSMRDQVGVLGDLDTALSTFGGAIGGSAGEALAAAGELSAVGEQAGILSDILPSTKLGFLGVIGAAGALAVGVLAVAQSFNEAAQAAARAEENIKAGIAGFREVSEIIVNGTEEQKRAAIEAAEAELRVIEFQNQQLQTIAQLGQNGAFSIEEAWLENQEALETLGITWEDFYRNTRSAIGEASNALRENEIAADQARTNIENLSASLDDTAPASDTATEATDGLSQSLAEMGMVAPEVANAVSDATRQQEAAQREAARAQEQAAREAEQAAQRIADAYRKNSEAIAQANQQYADQRADLIQSARDAEKDAARQNREAFFELRQGAFREEAQAYTDHQRELRNIQRDAQREREGLLYGLDFLGIFQQREAEAQRLEDAQQAYEDESEDRRTAYQQQLQDLKRAQQIERQERQRDLQRQLRDASTARNRAIRDANEALKRELEVAQQGYQAKLQLEAQYFEKSIGLQQSALGRQEQGISGSFNNTTSNTSTNVTFEQRNSFSGGSISTRDMTRMLEQSTRNTLSGLLN